MNHGLRPSVAASLYSEDARMPAVRELLAQCFQHAPAQRPTAAQVHNGLAALLQRPTIATEPEQQRALEVQFLVSVDLPLVIPKRHAVIFGLFGAIGAFSAGFCV